MNETLLTFLGGLFDFSQLAITCADIITDILVTIEFWNAGKLPFFGLMLTSLILASFVNAGAFVGKMEDHLCCGRPQHWYNWVLYVIIFAPIAQTLPVMNYILTLIFPELDESLDSVDWSVASPTLKDEKSDNDKKQGVAADEKEGITEKEKDEKEKEGDDGGDASNLLFIEQVSPQHAKLKVLDEAVVKRFARYFLLNLNCVVESVPNAVIQLIAISIAGGEVTTLQTLSLSLSLASVFARSYQLCRSFSVSAFTWKFFALGFDLLSMAFLFSSIFTKANHDDSNLNIDLFGITDFRITKLAFAWICIKMLSVTLCIIACCFVWVKVMGEAPNCCEGFGRGLALFLGFVVAFIPAFILQETCKLAYLILLNQSKSPSMSDAPYATMLHEFLHSGTDNTFRETTNFLETFALMKQHFSQIFAIPKTVVPSATVAPPTTNSDSDSTDTDIDVSNPLDEHQQKQKEKEKEKKPHHHHRHEEDHEDPADRKQRIQEAQKLRDAEELEIKKQQFKLAEIYMKAPQGKKYGYSNISSTATKSTYSAAAASSAARAQQQQQQQPHASGKSRSGMPLHHYQRNRQPPPPTSNINNNNNIHNLTHYSGAHYAGTEQVEDRCLIYRRLVQPLLSSTTTSADIDALAFLNPLQASKILEAAAASSSSSGEKKHQEQQEGEENTNTDNNNKNDDDHDEDVTAIPIPVSSAYGTTTTTNQNNNDNSNIGENENEDEKETIHMKKDDFYSRARHLVMWREFETLSNIFGTVLQSQVAPFARRRTAMANTTAQTRCQDVFRRLRESRLISHSPQAASPPTDEWVFEDIIPSQFEFNTSKVSCHQLDAEKICAALVIIANLISGLFGLFFTILHPAIYWRSWDYYSQMQHITWFSSMICLFICILLFPAFTRYHVSGMVWEKLMTSFNNNLRQNLAAVVDTYFSVPTNIITKANIVEQEAIPAECLEQHILQFLDPRHVKLFGLKKEDFDSLHSIFDVASKKKTENNKNKNNVENGDEDEYGNAVLSEQKEKEELTSTFSGALISTPDAAAKETS